MKHFYQLSGIGDNSLPHLTCSFLLGFMAMIFVNVFVGGMGGIGALAGVCVVFFMLRGIVLPGNRIVHQMAVDSRTEVRHFLLNYSLGYLLVWSVMRFVHLLSRISGWGNIGGLTFGEYVNRLYGSTLSERWAYLFVGILMFSYIASLFPLVLIRKGRRFVGYLAADHVFFAAVCGGIALVCRPFIERDKRRWGSCVLDDLLLCRLPERWEAVCYILGVVLFTILVLAVVYRIGVYEYAPRPGRPGPASYSSKSWRDYRIWIGGGLVLIMAGGIAVWSFFAGNSGQAAQYRKVAECLTEDSVLGPMVYGAEIYVPVKSEAGETEYGRALGYLGYKGEDCDTRFYELVIANLLYEDTEQGAELLQMQGADFGTFMKLSEAERRADWREDDIFLLWDEDWNSQMAYGNATGYCECERSLVEALQDQFGQQLAAEDFADYDAYFTIRGYGNMRSALQEGETGDWAGCILVKDNQFYYGSYRNRITGNLLNRLLGILGSR